MWFVAICNDVIKWNTTTVQVTTTLEFEMEPLSRNEKPRV